MPKARGSDHEEPPRSRGQGWQLGGATHARGQGRRLQASSLSAAERSYPVSEIRGGQEKPPRARGQGWWPEGATRGAVAEQAQEGLEKLSHFEGQERWQ